MLRYLLFYNYEHFLTKCLYSACRHCIIATTLTGKIQNSLEVGVGLQPTPSPLAVISNGKEKELHLQFVTTVGERTRQIIDTGIQANQHLHSAL